MAEIKSIAGMDRVPLNKVIPLDTPFSVYIFPTNLCNFKCNYCGHSLGHKEMKKKYDFDPISMPLETYKKTIDQLAEFPRKVKVISLTGHGEPLVNKNLPEMVRYAKEKNVTEKIEFISNASLLTHESSEQLVEAGLDCIRISIQGLTSEKYYEVCNYKLDFDKFIDEIAYLYKVKKQCQIYVKIMDVSLDEGEEEDFYKTFENICDRMFIEKCKPVYSGVESTQDIDISVDRYGRKHKPRLVCPFPFFMLGILPTGDVEPCEAIYKPEILGNVNNDTLLNMWNGEKMKEFRLMQLNKNRFDNPMCASCCAPDDVSHPEDELDEFTEEIINKL